LHGRFSLWCAGDMAEGGSSASNEKSVYGQIGPPPYGGRAAPCVLDHQEFCAALKVQKMKRHFDAIGDSPRNWNAVIPDAQPLECTIPCEKAGRADVVVKSLALDPVLIQNRRIPGSQFVQRVHVGEMGRAAVAVLVGEERQQPPLLKNPLEIVTHQLESRGG